MRFVGVGRGLAIGAAALTFGVPAAQAGIETEGSSGLGDSFFPQEGNGGYDVERYDIDLRYDPERNRFLGGHEHRHLGRRDAAPTASPSFNLDYRGPRSAR